MVARDSGRLGEVGWGHITVWDKGHIRGHHDRLGGRGDLRILGVRTRMRKGAASVIMADVVIRRLVIELEEGTLPVGRVVGVDGRRIAFAGWAELAAALEEARGGPAERYDASGADVDRSALRGRSPQQ